MKKLIVIGIIILIILSLSGCVDKSNLVSGEITGTMTEVEREGNDEVKITFSGNTYGIITVKKIDSDETNWYKVLKPHEGENVTITWICNYEDCVIGYVNFLE